MKINPQASALERSGLSTIRESQVDRGRDTSVQQSGTVPNDTVQISSDQTTLQGLVAGLDKVPDVRADRVQSLRTEIQSGAFQRTNDQVAGAIVNELASTLPNR